MPDGIDPASLDISWAEFWMRTKGKLLAIRLLAALTAALSASGTALATDVFNLEGYGPISRAMGGTGVAQDIGAAGMMYNPATLALTHKGAELHAGLDLITTDIKTRDEATGETASSNDHCSNRGPYYAPELAFSYRGDRHVLAVGAFAEGGLGTEYGSSSFLSRTTTNGINTGLDNSSRLLVLRIPFAAAYQVNDRLTFGASVDAVWTALNLGLLLDATQIGTLAADNRVSGSLVPVLLAVPGLSGAHFSFTKNRIVGGGTDAWGIGGKVGLTYQVSPETRIGLAYNARTDVRDLQGKATLTAVSSVAGNIPLTGNIRIRNFQMPDQVSVGISHRFSDRMTVASDYQRVFWKDVMKDINVGFVQDGTGANVNVLLPQHYRDINVYSIGVQYRYSDDWTFRGGAQYADNPIPDNMLLAVVPAHLTTHLTGGLSYAFNPSSRVDLALSFALQRSFSNSSQPNTSVPIESTHSQINAAIAYVHRF
jgi:long-chain fatty acid transport protein